MARRKGVTRREFIKGVTATGVLQHILHRSGADIAANISYVIHLMAVVPMLALEVPFSKWSHMAYRPLAMYFSVLRGKIEPLPAVEDSPAVGDSEIEAEDEQAA